MRILIDECLPAALKSTFAKLGHTCETVREAGYGSKRNGELLTIAEGRWDVLLTVDRNIRYQQNFAGREISVLILCGRSNRLKDLLPLIPACEEALLTIRRGQVVNVEGS